MSKVHYLVRRSRSGRFNFTLISEAGRLSGSVVVTTSKTGADMERDAHDQIRQLAETFWDLVRQTKPDTGDTPSQTCEEIARFSRTAAIR